MPTPTTQSEAVTAIQTITVQLTKNETDIKTLQATVKTLTADKATLTASLASCNADNATAVAAKAASDAALSKAQASLATAIKQNNTLLAQIADLQSQASVSQELTAELQDQFTQLMAKMASISSLLGTATPPPVVVSPNDAAILAEVMDNSRAGIDKRLGPTAAEMNPSLVVPDIWERPKVDAVQYMGTNMLQFSQGLGSQSDKPFDYSSDEYNGLDNSDLPLVVTPSAPGLTTDDVNASVNEGTGVFRLRTNEAAGGVVGEFPAIMWNGTQFAFPDRDSVAHVIYNQHAKLGQPIDIARAARNRYDVGFVLYDQSRGGPGFWGAVGTQTAYPSWAGSSLPDSKVPLCIALSSMNEFLFVGVHDTTTGKGQIGVYWLWAGNDLQSRQNQNFPFDFPVAHPGLMNSGMINGTKLFGFFDIPIAWPTSISAVCSQPTNGDRIQGTDGNASYLNIWQLSTEAQRSAFLGQNDSWIPHWMKVAVTSRYEDKACMVDFTSLSAGVRNQYFGSQALYDQTAYQKPSGVYDAYTPLTDPMIYPWGIEAKPDWAPVVTSTISVPKPKALLLNESGSAELIIACADGFLRYFQWDGTPDGSLHVGDNPVHLTRDKNAGIASGSVVVTCRGSRSIVMVSGVGTAAKVGLTIQDKAMEDPVACTVNDTHGIQMPQLTVADRNGRKVITYRAGPLKFMTQGGTVVGVGVDGKAAVERGGTFAIKGYPINGSDSNVN